MPCNRLERGVEPALGDGVRLSLGPERVIGGFRCRNQHMEPARTVENPLSDLRLEPLTTQRLVRHHEISPHRASPCPGRCSFACEGTPDRVGRKDVTDAATDKGAAEDVSGWE